MAGAKSTLLLIPTSGERSRLLNHLDFSGLAIRGWKCELCGFGLVAPAAAAAATTRAIRTHQPTRVILAGIAGGLSDAASVGSAHWFDEAICDGIGVGEGDEFVSADTLGWKQWASGDDESQESIGDRIELARPGNATVKKTPKNTLVSVCAASSDDSMASRRRNLAGETDRDAVIAEDMEAFGVAMACQMTSTPCMVVRGISNVAGDRDHSKWQIDSALRSVAERLMELN
ncbi:futalosine hydrolase [Rhodopirellula bahusiensis]|uniref:futalosine hydrolase n=1 Tax=Rhodopirellula bahusiensis TaxID=2014065 RepID=UPI00329A7658